jgi:CelD/BcsL family acetyltransferase involved in cellulose biosynthesis
MPCEESVAMFPRLSLNGRDIDAVESEWTASHRKDIRRQRKRLAAERGPVSLWQPASVEEAEPVLTEFFRVYNEKWLTQGCPDIAFDAKRQGRFRALLRDMWGSGVHFSTVRCGDIDVSYHFGFLAGGWLQWYCPSYRPEFRAYSPGKIHVTMLIEEACRSKWLGVDFLLGEETYKHLWANDSMEVVNFQAGFHSLAPSYFWFTRGKRWAKRWLGPAIKARTWLQSRGRKQLGH